MSTRLGMKRAAVVVFLASALAAGWALSAFAGTRGGEVGGEDHSEGNPVAAARVLDDTRGIGVYRLRENDTREMPEDETAFRVIWEEGALIFDIRCYESDMENLDVAGDAESGDSVAILLEPPGRSYYHIEVNPDGKVFDADRREEGSAEWESLADVWSQRGEGFWRVAVRIPVVPEADGADRKVVGSRPSEEEPWRFNVRRRRVRGEAKSTQVFSPTDGSNYRDRDTFGKLVMD